MKSVFTMFATTAFAVGIMLSGNTSAKAQPMEPVELFTNGSMTGDTGRAKLPDGWIKAGGSCDTLDDDDTLLGSPKIASSSPDGGTFFSCIGYADQSGESFKQTITVDSGTEYTISYSAANFGGVSWWIGATPGTGSWEVVLDGEVLATSAALPVAAGWSTVTATFTASSPTHDIEFRAKHADDDPDKRVFLQIDGLSAMTTEDYKILNPPPDNTAPTVELTPDATGPQSGLFTVTATFSEDVQGFEEGDVSVNNGKLSNFQSTSDSVYTFGVTPDTDGNVTVDVAADVAQDAATNGNAAATQLSVTMDGTAPTVGITGPTDVVTEDFTVTFTFSENVTGFTADDVTVTNGTKGAFSGSGTTYTLMVTPALGTTVSVSVDADAAEDDAGNGNTVSDVFEVSAGSPASEFERYAAEIRQVIVDEAERSLGSALSANQRMVRGARDRFIGAQREQAGCIEEDTSSSDEYTCDVGLVTPNTVPFDVDGTFAINDTTLSTRGSFFEQTGNYEGTQRSLFFGDFDVQHDGDTGSTTATLTGRMAWEQMTSEQTMLGYFIGGELAYSNIDGAFDGDQDRLGVAVGGYAVHQLADELFLDGFLTMGAGNNNLEMANDVLALTSDYTTHTATAGAALSGIYEYDQYEFRPELAFSYGKTWIGDVDFTGRAYGLVDNTLSLDAGNVSIANLTLSPEVVWALDGDTVAESNSHFSFAPRLICESRETVRRIQDCGGGAEIGLSSQSDDGLRNVEFRVIMDRVGNSTRSSFAFNLEHQF